MPNTIEVPYLVGQTITAVRPMTKAELEAFGWHDPLGGLPIVIETDAGTTIIPARDPELNGFGHLLGLTESGECYDISAEGNDA